MKYTAILFAAISTMAADLVAAQSFSGDVTFFYPGLGACGQTNGNGDFIAAVSSPVFDQGSCGRRMRVHHNDKHVDVTVVDRCPGCAYGDVDLSPAAFDQLASQSEGRIHGTWEFI